MVVLDSTFLIDLQRGRRGAAETLEDLLRAGHALRVPAAAWVEYLSAFPEPGLGPAMRALEARATFVAFDRGVAEAAAALQHDLSARGRPLAPHDLQVAATALRLDEPLVSNDRAFRRVRGLVVLGH